MSDEISELEIKCPSCDGRGSFAEGEEPSICPRCEGSGFVPTPAGERILALVRHHSKISAKLRIFSAR